MGKEVIFSEESEVTLKELAVTLFRGEYVGFMDSAEKYVDRLRSYARQNIGKPPIREAPPHFRRSYGNNLKYIVYRVHKTTAWYIFYQEESERFLVRHIANNYEAARFF
jgi:chlorite dismutase